MSDDFSAVGIASPFDDFKGSPIPSSIREYDEYRNAAITFIEARNRRIKTFVSDEYSAHERAVYVSHNSAAASNKVESPFP